MKKKINFWKYKKNFSFEIFITSFYLILIFNYVIFKRSSKFSKIHFSRMANKNFIWGAYNLCFLLLLKQK